MVSDNAAAMMVATKLYELVKPHYKLVQPTDVYLISLIIKSLGKLGKSNTQVRTDLLNKRFNSFINNFNHNYYMLFVNI